MSTNDTWINGGLAVTNGRDLTISQENPFGTKHGQSPVSVVESFWARIAREGRTRGAIAQGLTLAAGVETAYCITTPALGTRMYPRLATVSCDQDAELTVYVDPGFADAQIIKIHIFAKAGTPLIVKFDGECYFDNSGRIQVLAKAATVGKVYASTYCVEVPI